MKAKDGNKVRVHYTLKDAEGKTVDTTRDESPIEFTIGEGRVISGFDKAITGMSQNETKTVTMQPEDAYGKYEEKKVFDYAKKNAPGDFDPRIGDTIMLHWPTGKSFQVKVLKQTESGYLMDANHPLAGKCLKFDLELVEIVS